MPVAFSKQDLPLQGFRPIPGPASVQPVVAVNDSVINRREFPLVHTYGAGLRLVDLGSREDVTEQSEKDKLVRDAGMGKVFALGPTADIAAFRQACGVTGGL